VTTFQALTTVSGLHKGKTAAREPAPIRPVAPEVVDATLPFLPSAAADMVRLQRLTGCRPGEIVLLRPRDVDRSNPVWQYRPMSHKTEHHGRERVVLIGPSAQAILAPYLSLHDKDAFCFQTERPNRNKSGGRYTSQSYHQRVHSACDAADAKAHEERRETPANERLVPRWAPNQLRHAAATEIRSRFGLEAASTVLGHSKADVTQIYAERDLQKAAAIMAAVG
jgi:integrase